MGFSLRTSFLGRHYYQFIQKRFLPYIEKTGLTPNQLTLAGVLCAVIVPLGFHIHVWMGFILMVISGFVDSMDGFLARHRHQETLFGAFLDSSLDRLSDFFYLCGFWVLFWPSPSHRAATAMIVSAVLSTLMISYVKARAEALGQACPVGFMERGVRVVYLLIWALAIIAAPCKNAVLWLGLWLYLALTAATVVQRILYIRAHMPPPR